MTACKSSFTLTTTRSFWENQIGVQVAKTAAINAEGIDRPEDLFDYSKDDLESVFENLRKPLVTVVSGVIVPVAPHALSSKSKKRIVMASDATRYYALIGRDITPSNMEWSTLENFDVHVRRCNVPPNLSVVPCCIACH